MPRKACCSQSPQCRWACSMQSACTGVCNMHGHVCDCGCGVCVCHSWCSQRGRAYAASLFVAIAVCSPCHGQRGGAGVLIVVGVHRIPERAVEVRRVLFVGGRGDERAVRTVAAWLACEQTMMRSKWWRRTFDLVRRCRFSFYSTSPNLHPAPYQSIVRHHQASYIGVVGRSLMDGKGRRVTAAAMSWRVWGRKQAERKHQDIHSDVLVHTGRP